MKSKPCGFRYHITDEALKEYGKKPMRLRLAWLYQGNILRKALPKRIVKLQDKFREGII
ncbi:MAG TPA: hypothetical protein PKL03_02750 [Candidatus Omnitrophota bacterium]|nr:hypothetical protein [Candidatus Omnitrophota bacterium]